MNYCKKKKESDSIDKICFCWNNKMPFILLSTVICLFYQYIFAFSKPESTLQIFLLLDDFQEEVGHMQLVLYIFEKRSFGVNWCQLVEEPEVASGFWIACILSAPH